MQSYRLNSLSFKLRIKLYRISIFSAPFSLRVICFLWLCASSFSNRVRRAISSPCVFTADALKAVSTVPSPSFMMCSFTQIDLCQPPRFNFTMECKFSSESTESILNQIRLPLRCVVNHTCPSLEIVVPAILTHNLLSACLCFGREIMGMWSTCRAPTWSKWVTFPCSWACLCIIHWGMSFTVQNLVPTLILLPRTKIPMPATAKLAYRTMLICLSKKLWMSSREEWENSSFSSFFDIFVFLT